MEGLDATVLSLKEVLDDNEKFRIDDGYFAKDAVFVHRRMESLPHTRLGEICTKFRKGIFDIQADSYTEFGVPFVRIGDLKGGLIDSSKLVYISHDRHILEQKTALKSEDIVLSKTAYPSAALVTLPECNVSQDTIAVRLSTKGQASFKSGFIVAFLCGRYGQALMSRQFQGNVQLHLSLPDGKKLPLPRLSFAFQEIVHTALLAAHEATQGAQELSRSGERGLLVALDLADWKPPQPLAYTRRASEVFEAERLDSDYFAPRVKNLLTRLSRDGITIGDVAPPRIQKFDPTSGGEFDYVEIGDVRSDGTVGSTRMPRSDAPSRAAWHVHTGDVVTSTVRPNRRLSALITPDQDGFVCSSGFVVLNPQRAAPEVVLTYLRLPLVCELMDLHTSASMYPSISEKDLLALPFPKISPASSAKIVSAVQSAHAARRRAHDLLERAKRAVEIAIEDSEPAALKYLRD